MLEILDFSSNNFFSTMGLSRQVREAMNPWIKVNFYSNEIGEEIEMI
jgi:hypothetical protein